MRRAFREKFMVEPLDGRMLASASVLPAFGRLASPAVLESFAGLTPAQIRKAYGFDQVGNWENAGEGQTIAIVDAYHAPSLQADLAEFNATFGLPESELVVVGQKGTDELPVTDPWGPGHSWAIETTLDVEWAHALAPKATILVVEANSAALSDLMTAVDTARNFPGVTVVSMSWGGDESPSTKQMNRYFRTPAGHEGVTFVASSGDAGIFGQYGSRAVAFPAASPNVLSVGGTTLTMDADGMYLGETGWGNGAGSFRQGGAGGGVSKYQARPPYQTGVVEDNFRSVPDVAFNADPESGVAVLDSWDFGDNGWARLGGTSLAAPMWAAVMAIANQERRKVGLGSLEGASQTLPMLYAMANDGVFRDIVRGNNGYPAGVGYDSVTGLGTPIVDRVVKGLVERPAPLAAPLPVIGALVTPNSVKAGVNVMLSAEEVGVVGGMIRSVALYREINGVPGLQSGSDWYLGVAKRKGMSWVLQTSTRGMPTGAYTYYAVATDVEGMNSTAVSAQMTVAADIKVASKGMLWGKWTVRAIKTMKNW